nr:LTA synthase family protein [Clostridia bacterium]
MGRRPILLCFIIGTLLYSFIEIIGRHSVTEFCDYFINDFFVFVYNDLIVVATLAFSLFAKRRLFAVSLISAGWLTLGVTNCILLIFRITPLNVSDFRIIFDAVSMLGVYLKPLHFVLIFIGFTILGVTLAFIWRRSEKIPTQLIRALGSVSALSLTLVLFTVIGINSSALTENFEEFDNLCDAYDDSGFVYGFAKTVMDRGIAQPDTYCEETMDMLYKSITAETDCAVQSDANIIFLQLESAFDVSRLVGLEVSEDPMPTYTALKNSHSSGLLTVPTIGSGTANMEFEVLTGMMLDCFGAGEYPYYTVLTEKSCESMAYIARAAGMTAHAFHNYDGAFYGRNVVLDNLGFNTYTSIEYMKDVEYNALGWADDMVLKGAIIDALDLTDGFDFVFATTITSHGAYPSDIEPDGDITVNYGDDPELTAKFEYYVNELRKVDNFVGALIEELSKRGEKTVVVMYGDHLPSLELDDKPFVSGDSHTT